VVIFARKNNRTVIGRKSDLRDAICSSRDFHMLKLMEIFGLSRIDVHGLVLL